MNVWDSWLQDNKERAKRRATAPAIAWGAGWTWPVAPVRFSDGKTYSPVVSNAFKAGPHYGVDVMFRRRAPSDRLELYPHGKNGTPGFFAPPGTPIVAAKAGRVYSVAETARGWHVVLDHGKPFATFYQHLERVTATVKSGAVVKAGDQLGTMGGSPARPPHLRHLHFAVWYKGAGDKAAIDSEKAMQSWGYAPAWDVPA